MGSRSSSPAYSTPSVSPAKRQHTATLIFLHGLGDDGPGWSQILPNYVPDYVKIVCPHARRIPVTINGFQRMPAWFDILGFAPSSPQDEVNISQSSKYIETLIAEEVSRGIAHERVVVAGFSQGGAIALFTALKTEKKLGGVIALSSWLPMHSHFVARGNAYFVNRTTPVLQCHGKDDELLPFAIGQLTSQILKGKLGFTDIEFRSFDDLGHSSSSIEMNELRKFLDKAVPREGEAAREGTTVSSTSGSSTDGHS